MWKHYLWDFGILPGILFWSTERFHHFPHVTESFILRQVQPHPRLTEAPGLRDPALRRALHLCFLLSGFSRVTSQAEKRQFFVYAHWKVKTFKSIVILGDSSILHARKIAEFLWNKEIPDEHGETSKPRKSVMKWPHIFKNRCLQIFQTVLIFLLLQVWRCFYDNSGIAFHNESAGSAITPRHHQTTSLQSQERFL